MAHLSGYCDCGRRIHFPKDAEYGYEWTCYRCGRSYVLSRRGDPLYRIRSRRPPQTEDDSYDTPSFEFSWQPWMTKGVGLLVVLAAFGPIGLAVAVGGWVWLKSNGKL